ncbi:zinc-binding alcohol dehydrogenase family protein [Lichenicola sp.]|uniref:zinc-binding alcohol dehydrogenase family protein n=1 Tax=Lichenicola sp. TaxID=2804529 RepID=UPI003B00B0A3
MTMRAIVCETPGLLQRVERPMPVRGEDEVLVRIRRVGVCGTDLHIFSGNQPYLSYPRVMGHELSGTVEEAPPGSGLATSDIVFIMPYMSCGRCHACLQGKTNCCSEIQVLGVHRDGGMTEFLSLPRQFVHHAEGVSLEQAAMIEFLAIGAHAVRRGRAAPGQSVLVVGAGPIGLAVALFAIEAGARVVMLDGRADRLAFAMRHLAVSGVVQLGEADTAELSALTDGNFFDVVFDATGNAAAMERGFGFVAHGGTYLLVSIVADRISFSDPEFHKRETSLLGSRNATIEDFRQVLEVMRAGRIPTDALCTHRMTLDAVPTDFHTLLDPGQRVVKGMIEI